MYGPYLSLLTLADVQGEQVFISYGEDQTNDSLLQFYGFVEPDSPKDIYVLQDFTPRAVAAAQALKVPVARVPRLPDGEGQFDAELVRTGPSKDVLQHLCTLLGLTLQPETHSAAYQVCAGPSMLRSEHSPNCMTCLVMIALHRSVK